MAKDQPVLLEMKDVVIPSTRDGAVPAIQTMQWRIEMGDRWVIGGLPGCGKSALLMTAVGLLNPLQGELELFGIPSRNLSEADHASCRRQLGMLFEGGGRLFAQMTTAENIALPYQYHRNLSFESAVPEVERLLKLTGLKDCGNLSPNRVPRNLCPRVALARALITRPRLLFLDNPLRGMDVRQTRWWSDVIQGLSEGHALVEGKPITVVVTTEDFRPWLDWGDNFAVVRDQTWLEVGNREAVRNHTNPAVQELLAQTAHFD
ncbi:MAG: ATP-binding cassette domain-containing protein [Verrucomicrobiota bacterium]